MFRLSILYRDNTVLVLWLGLRHKKKQKKKPLGFWKRSRFGTEYLILHQTRYFRSALSAVSFKLAQPRRKKKKLPVGRRSVSFSLLWIVKFGIVLFNHLSDSGGRTEDRTKDLTVFLSLYKLHSAIFLCQEYNFFYWHFNISSQWDVIEFRTLSLVLRNVWATNILLRCGVIFVCDGNIIKVWNLPM